VQAQSRIFRDPLLLITTVTGYGHRATDWRDVLPGVFGKDRRRRCGTVSIRCSGVLGDASVEFSQFAFLCGVVDVVCVLFHSVGLAEGQVQIPPMAGICASLDDYDDKFVSLL
jgi:hypothetical protein